MSERLAICMFNNSLVRGGAEEHMLGLLRALDRSRFRPLMAAPAALLDMLRPDLPPDVETFACELFSPLQAAAALRLARFVRREQVQIMHSHLFRASLVGSPAARLGGVPVTVETPHVRELWRRGWKSSYAIDRAAGRFVDAYIAVSRANARYLAEEKRLPLEKIAVIRNGCELEHFSPARRASAGLRRELGFGEDDPVLLLSGRLEPQKGHAVALDALVMLHREFPGVRLVCIGEGALRAELERKTEVLGLADAVRWMGRQSIVQEWIALADVCVLPSFYEGLPLVAMECLACARPMVATEVDGTPEIILHEKTGLLVSPGDAASLAEAVARLLRSPQLAASLAQAGRSWVENHFTFERQVRETEELYTRLWSRKTGRQLAPAPEEARCAD